MEVIATRDGHYGGIYRNEGEKFTVEDDAKASWFKPVADGDSEESPKPRTRGGTGTGVAGKVANIGEVNIA